MMIKKGYIMIALAIVSVLLGSLVYNSVTQADTGRFQVYRETVKICVLSPRDSALPFSGIQVPGIKLPFEFNAKERFLNVTDVWVFIVIGPEQYRLSGFEVTMDAIEINDVSVPVTGTYSAPTGVSVHIQDPFIYGTIFPGINTLTLRYLEVYRGYVFETSILITYEYQTR